MGNQLTESTSVVNINWHDKNIWKTSSARLVILSVDYLSENNVRSLKVESFLQTSEDKRNQVTPLHTGKLASGKLLKYYLTTAYYGTSCQEENPLLSASDGGSSEQFSI